MRVAISGNRPSIGTVVAEVNLKLIWDVISAIARSGRPASHSCWTARAASSPIRTSSLVLRGADEVTLKPFQAIRARRLGVPGAGLATGRDTQGNAVAAVRLRLWLAWNGRLWSNSPSPEAFGPIYAALRRTAALLLGGAILAGLLAYALARRMTEPIRRLEEGTERIGAGQFEHRIHIRTGDELQRLADSFNAMAAGLAVVTGAPGAHRQAKAVPGTTGGLNLVDRKGGVTTDCLRATGLR